MSAILSRSAKNLKQQLSRERRPSAPPVLYRTESQYISELSKDIEPGNPLSPRAEASLRIIKLNKLEAELWKPNVSMSFDEQEKAMALVLISIKDPLSDSPRRALDCLKLLVRKVGSGYLLNFTVSLWDFFARTSDNAFAFLGLQIILQEVPVFNPPTSSTSSSLLSTSLGALTPKLLSASSSTTSWGGSASSVLILPSSSAPSSSATASTDATFQNALIDCLLPKLIERVQEKRDQVASEEHDISKEFYLIRLIHSRFGLTEQYSPFISRTDEYICIHEIGKRNNCKLYLAIRAETGQQVTVKIIEKEVKQLHRDLLENEISVLKELIHPNIVRLLDVKRSTARDPMLYLVMEYGSLGTLGHYITKHNRLSEEESRKIMTQIAKALEFLRSKSILHRNLKPDSILLSPGKKGHPIVKLADFSFARRSDEEGTTSHTPRGNSLFTAPELYYASAEKIDKKYSNRADLWSLGVTFFMMLSGKIPIETPEISHLDVPETLSETCKNLLTALLKKDPKERISWENFFIHPFLGRSRQLERSQSVLSKKVKEGKKEKQRIIEEFTNEKAKMQEEFEIRLRAQESKYNKKLLELESQLRASRRREETLLEQKTKLEEEKHSGMTKEDLRARLPLSSTFQ